MTSKPQVIHNQPTLEYQAGLKIAQTAPGPHEAVDPVLGPVIQQPGCYGSAQWLSAEQVKSPRLRGEIVGRCGRCAYQIRCLAATHTGGNRNKG